MLLSSLNLWCVCCLTKPLFGPQDSSEIHFKVKMTTHLKKLKDSYSQRQVRTRGVKYVWTLAESKTE